MDLLKAEMARKRKQLEDKNICGPNKKYYKRKDLAAKQEEEYWSKHQRLNIERVSSRKESIGDEEADKVLSPEVKPMLSRKEVIRRLRDRDEPISLFGETEYEAYQRLKKQEILEPEVEVDKGQKNDYFAAVASVDQEYLKELAGGKKAGATEASLLQARMTEDEMQEMADELGEDEERDQELMHKFLRYLLLIWEEKLSQRGEAEKHGMKGKHESVQLNQTQSYIKPLLQKLKTKTCSSDIRVRLVDVIKFLLAREYLKANEAYMEMAVGNAPWPIGVTMVGIHARTGREKINDKNVAHVLNDEAQRKYIQAFKRLMTKCQTFFPTDPSKMVNYERPTQ